MNSINDEAKSEDHPSSGKLSNPIVEEEQKQ